MFGEELLLQTVASAAGTMVSLMASEAWSNVRSRMAQIIRRGGDGSAAGLVDQLESSRAQVASAPAGGQELVLREQQALWTGALQNLVSEDPTLADELRSFVEEFRGRVPVTHVTLIRQDFHGPGARVQLVPGPGGPAETEAPGGARPGPLTVAPPLGRLDRRVRGRGELLRSLKELVGRPDSGVHVLHGLGGCGKTTIALETAAHAGEQGMDVWWVTAADVPTLSAGMREVAACLGAPEGLLDRAWSGRASATDLLWRLLGAAQRPWLLVIDNADAPEHLAPGGDPADGTGWLRPCGALSGTVLVTSRDGRQAVWGAWSTLHAVGALAEDATQVLWDLAGEEAGPRADAARLARHLGGLPLALRIAGAYLLTASAMPVWPGTRAVTTYAGYLDALDDRFTELLGHAPAGGRALAPQGEPVSRTFELSLDLLERRGYTEARTLLRLLSCLGAAPVPYLLLLRPDVLAASRLLPGIGPDRLATVLFALADLGLLELHRIPQADEATARTLLVHPLVRAANRHQQDLDSSRQAYAGLLAELLSTAVADLDTDDPAGWPRWQLLVPHLDSPLRLMSDPAAAGRDLVTKALRPALAGVRHLFTIGWLDRAEAVLDACRDAVAQDAPDTETLQLRFCAAHLLQERGRLAEAEAMLRAALADTVALHGPDGQDAADARHALAVLLDYRGRTAEAEAEYRAVYAARSSALGPDDPQTLAARKGVARMSQQRGRLHEAEQEYRLVLEACREALGEQHPDTLATRHDLGRVLHELGMYPQAEQHFRQTLLACREVMGPAHPSTLDVRHDLADVLRDRGTLQEAEAEFRAVLGLRRDAQGEDHPGTVAARYGLATVLRDRGWPGDAEQVFREVFELRRGLLGDDHPHTLVVRHNLADLLKDRGLLEEAETEFRHVYEARRTVLGEHHLLTLSVRHGTARVLHLRGLLDQAETEYRSVLTDCNNILGHHHPGTLDLRHNLADLLKDRGLLEEAETEFRQVHEARRTVLGEHHPQTRASLEAWEEVRRSRNG